MTESDAIAMVEDDEGHARLIEKHLRRAGLRNKIFPLRDGATAMDFLFGPKGSGLVNEGRPLLILLDLNLPDMSGVDILKRLKESDHLRTIPVVVLTTTDDATEIQRCYEVGCNFYVTKPVDYERFTKTIQQLGMFVSVMQIPQVA